MANQDSAILDGQVRTTLTGKPIQYQHDHHTTMMMADGVGAFGSAGTAGANLLPPGYTDKSLVHIPIKSSDLLESRQVDQEQKQRSLKKLFSRRSSAEEIKVVPMSRGDYLRYWAKGEDGQFLPNVETPAEGRAEWVRRQLEQYGE